MLIKQGVNVMHLNSWVLEGLSKDQGNLESLLEKTLSTYTAKNS
jgi:hypothetical protein